MNITDIVNQLSAAGHDDLAEQVTAGPNDDVWRQPSADEQLVEEFTPYWRGREAEDRRERSQQYHKDVDATLSLEKLLRQFDDIGRTISVTYSASLQKEERAAYRSFFKRLQKALLSFDDELHRVFMTSGRRRYSVEVIDRLLSPIDAVISYVENECDTALEDYEYCTELIGNIRAMRGDVSDYLKQIDISFEEFDRSWTVNQNVRQDMAAAAIDKWVLYVGRDNIYERNSTRSGAQLLSDKTLEELLRDTTRFSEVVKRVVAFLKARAVEPGGEHVTTPEHITYDLHGADVVLVLNSLPQKDLHRFEDLLTDKDSHSLRGHGFRWQQLAQHQEGLVKNFATIMAGLDRAYEMVRSKGFGQLWYGRFYVGNEARRRTYDQNGRIRTADSIAGHYYVDERNIAVYSTALEKWKNATGNANYIAEMTVHELGHRLYFAHLTDTQRNAWKDWFATGEIVHVTDYAKTDEDEAFAEVFTAIVANAYPIDRQQIDQFKALLDMAPGGMRIRASTEGDDVNSTATSDLAAANTEMLNNLVAEINLTGTDRDIDIALNFFPHHFSDWLEELGDGDGVPPELQNIIDQYEDWEDTGIIDDLHRADEQLVADYGEWLFDHYSYDIYNDPFVHPPYLTFSGAQLMPDDWLVHFTDDARAIVNEGFVGNVIDTRNLALTGNTPKSMRDDDSGFAFAFEPNDVASYAGDRHGGFKYGKEAVLFRAESVRTWHAGDREPQHIFWGPAAHAIMRIVPDGRDEWRLLDANYEDVFEQESEADPSLEPTRSMDDLIEWVAEHVNAADGTYEALVPGRWQEDEDGRYFEDLRGNTYDTQPTERRKMWER